MIVFSIILSVIGSNDIENNSLWVVVTFSLIIVNDGSIEFACTVKLPASFIFKLLNLTNPVLSVSLVLSKVGSNVKLAP
jgi:hypothetical protein